MSAIIQPYHADSDDEDNIPLAQVQNAPPLPPGEHAVPIRCIDDHEHEAYVHNDSPMNACRTMFDELRYYLIDDLDRLVMEYVDDVFPLKSAQTFVLSTSGEEPSVQEIVMTSENEVACVIPQQSTVKIFNLDSGTFTMSFSSSSKVIAAKFLDLQTVKLLVTSSWSDSLQIWNTENGECLHTIKSNWMPLLDVMRVMVPPDTTACLSKWRPSYRLRLVTASISKEQMLVYEVDENSCQLVSTCRVTPPDEWQVADDSEIPQLAIIRQQYALFTFPCTLDKNYLFYELYLLPMGEHVGGGHIVLSENPNAASLSSYTIRALDYNKASDNEHAEFPDLGISAPEGVRLYRLKIPASAPVSRPFATPPSSPIMRPMLSKTKSPPPMKIVLDHFNTLRWPFPERVTYFGAMPGWPRLVAVDSSGNMLIWDARTGAEVYYVSFVHSDMNKVTFLPSPSGRALLTLGSNEKYGEWKLWKRCFRS